MIIKSLRNKRGEGYIDIVVIVLVFVLMISFSLSVYPVFVAKSQVNKFAGEIIREVEVTGQVGNSVNSRIKKLKSDLIDIDNIEFDAKYIDGTKKIQLDSPVDVVVEKTVDIGFFEFGSFPIKLRAKDSGFSEVYWK